MLKVADAGGEASDEVTKFADALKAAQAKADGVQKALSLKAALTETTTSLAAAKAALAQLDAEFDRSDTSSRKVSKAFTDAEKAVADLTAEQTNQSVALQKAEGALQKAGVDTTNLAAAYARAQTEGASAAKSLADVGTAATGAGKGTKEAADSTKQLGDRAKESGGLIAELKEHLVEIVSVATAVEVALKGIEFGRDSLKEAAAIEQSLSQVKAAAKDASADFDALGEEIEKAARAANVSGTTAAQAAEALAKQGESTKEIFETLTPTLLLARDANIDVAQAAGVVDDVLDLFGKDASEAADAVDKLVIASKGSKEGLAGMADAIRTLAPDARELGLSFDQLVGLLGLMSQNGIDAGKATRGLRTIFQQLQDPTSKFSDALGQLGDSSSDFGKAIETLRGAGAKGQDALLSLDGAARSLVLFLLQQAPGAVDAFVASLGKVQGAALQTRKTIDDNLSGAFTAFENSLDAIGSSLLSTTLKPLREELQQLSDRLNAFADSPAFAKLKTALAGLFTEGVAAFEQFVSKVDFSKLIDEATEALQNGAKTIGEFKDDLGTVATALSDIGNAIGVVFRAIAVVFDLAKTGAGALGSALTSQLLLFSKAVDAVHGSTSQATLDLQALHDSAQKTASEGFTALQSNSDKLVEHLTALGTAAGTTSTNIDTLKASFESVQAGVQSSATSLTQTATDFNVLSGGVENVANALGILPDLFNADATAAQAATTAHTEHAKAIVAAKAAVDAARSALDDLVKSGNASAESMHTAEKAYEDAQKTLNGLTSAATGASDQVDEAQRRLKQAFTDLKISSQAELDEAAKKAKANLDVIVDAFNRGKASADDVQRAFNAYFDTVQKQFSASTQDARDQEQAILDSQAAALGLIPVYDKVGKSGQRAGRDTSDGMDKAKTSTDAAAGSAKKLKDTLDEASDSADAFNASSQAWGDSLADAATAAASADAGIRILTADQLRAFTEISQEFNSGAITFQQYEDRISDALNGTTIELDKQIEALQKFNDKVADLQSQIAGANGDDVAVESIRHEKALQDIKDEGDLTLAQRKKLDDLENQLHEANLKRIKQENDARKDTGGTNATSGSGDDGAKPSAPTPTPRHSTVNVTPNILLLSGDKNASKQLAQLLARDIKSELDSIGSRSR